MNNYNRYIGKPANKAYDTVRLKPKKSKIRARPNKRLIEDVFN